MKTHPSRTQTDSPIAGGTFLSTKGGALPRFWRALGSWFFFFDDLHGLEGCVLHVSGGAPRWCLADFFRKTSPNRLEGKFFRGAVMNFQRFVCVLVKQLWQFVLNDLMILISDARSWVVHPTPTRWAPDPFTTAEKKKNDRYPYKWVCLGFSKTRLFSGLLKTPWNQLVFWPILKILSDPCFMVSLREKRSPNSPGPGLHRVTLLEDGGQELFFEASLLRRASNCNGLEFLQFIYSRKNAGSIKWKNQQNCRF